MKRVLHSVFLAAVALCGVQGARAATDPRFNAFMGRVVGNSTTVSFGGNGQPLVTSSAGLGTPTLGNMALSQAGKNVSLAGGIQAPLGDTARKVAATARAPITRAAFVRGLGAVVSNPLVGIGLAVLAPSITSWLESGGVRMNPNADDYPEKPFLRSSQSVCTTNCPLEYKVNHALITAWRSSPNAACADYAAYLQNTEPPYKFGLLRVEAGSSCVFKKTTPEDPGWSVEQRAGLVTRESQIPDTQWWPASLDDIAPYMDRPEAPSLHPDVVYESMTKLTGVDPFGAEQPKVTVTGPATVPGQKVQTSTQVRVHPGTTTEVAPGTTTDTQQATKLTETTQTHKVTYQGDKISYTTVTTTTTNITNNVTGDTITNVETTETENDAPEDVPEEPPVDTPLGDIPKLYERKYPDGITGIWNQKSQELKATPLLTFASSLMPTVGGGSCPSWTLDLNLEQYMDMGTHVVQPPCWVWDVARAIVIVSALLLARALIFGG